MNAQDQIKYYTSRCVSLMNQIETNTQKLMHETIETADLEKAVWNASDEKDLIRLKALHNRLAKLADGGN